MAYQSKDSYPRPDFVRSNHKWAPLNDGWTILYDDDDIGLEKGWHISGVPDSITLSTQHVKKPINVPFAFQTPASGINDNEAHEVFWYERLSFLDPRSQAEIESNQRVILRFGAVDYEMTLWAGGILVGSHRGGHVPIEMDVTDALAAHASLSTPGQGGKEVRLVMRVRDSPHDLAQPRGKQYWAPQPESIFYTPTSGIWQPVWSEVVPPARIGDGSAGTILNATDITGGKLSAKIAVVGRRAGHRYSVEIEGFFQGQSVATRKSDLPSEKDYVRIDVPLSLRDEHKGGLARDITAPEGAWRGNLALWSPAHPHLYDLTIRLYSSPSSNSAILIDEVKTYTGFRHIDYTRGNSTLYLNHAPLFQALVLDQGYWPDSGLTPPTPDSCRRDIELSKAMGFNGCRKHQKVEDPLFLYWADRLGYLVWGEMANAYEFSDTYAAAFDAEWTEAVRRDVNHPCVVAWTPVNESWGYPALKESAEQRNHIRELYYLTKTLDPTRPVNDNCGWEHVCTDLTTFHSYLDHPELKEMCATLEGGILEEKVGRDMFVARITDDSSGERRERDPGAAHRPGAPVLCTEFGGVNIAPAATGDTGEKKERDWGYTTAADPADLLKRLEGLVMAVVDGDHCCGFVYTQLTDIEQEVNGLYSFDRREKIPAAEVKKIIDKATKAYFDRKST
ncbi:glycoside hydrolase family 2 protein [Microdochium bolleyi]|uniref:Glycoside hydrolase family 2 protein n=1 Tax=Microdochium bolleyi TaxID=196109 RepID=A0A136JFY4_9PEZI|nr:glycoside hydrolase family 2 protein [Microdochium bolleyi]